MRSGDLERRSLELGENMSRGVEESGVGSANKGRMLVFRPKAGAATEGRPYRGDL
jgi:hypothetical protein